MKLTRWKALYFYHVLSLLFFTCYCTSCREEGSDKILQPPTTSNQPSSVAHAADTITLLAQADLLFQLGETYLKAKKNDSSNYYHQQALELRERAGMKGKEMFDSYLRVGGFYMSALKYDIANKYFEKAQPHLAHPGITIDEQIRYWLDYSNIKTNLKDIPTSISLLNRLRNIVQTHRPDDQSAWGRIYFSFANAYLYDNQFEQAILNYRKSSFFFNQLNDYRLSGIIYTAQGMLYNRMNDNTNALISFRNAIQTHLKWTEPESNELAKVYLQKAVTHENLGEFDSAQYYYQWNLRIRRKVFGEKDTNTFGAKLSLGQFYRTIHNYDSAVKYAHESLISLVKDFNNPDISTNPIADPTELNIDLVLGLVDKGNALKLLSEHDNSRDYYKLALKTYLLADSVFSVFRRNLRYDDPQLREMEAGYIPYHLMIELTFHLFQNTGDREYIKKSIDIMEQSRSVLLENALNRAQEYDTTGNAYAFIKEENELLAQRAEILRQLSVPELSEAIKDSLSEALLHVSNSSAKWRESIEQTNPGYFNLKYDQREIRVAEIQALLKKRNSILLEYLWSDEKIYALAIGPYKIETKIILQTNTFKKSFEDFTAQLKVTPDQAIRLENFNRFSQSAWVLYQNLIRDLIPKDSDRNREVNLIVSANGPLSTIPFEALITQAPQNSDVNYKLPYLIESFPVSYAYSPGILVKQSKHDRDGSKLLALGFAGSGTSRVQRDGLNNLPGTEEEINSIKAVMKNNTNKYYLENEASEAMFKNQVSDFDIVHLAIHGMADSTNALKSKLVFRSEADTVEDSNLYAHELYNLNLEKLDLAVLSACESGIGKQQAGEGAMSIARGFAYAGCPSAVISLWKINDHTSAQVMGDFYKYISIGEDIDKALAHAKLDYINTSSEFNSHPAYWAAFLQVGDTRAIEIEKYDWMIVISVLVILISGAAGYRLRTKKAS